jgi:hypothetical protein
MAVMERTIPDSGDAVQRHFDRTRELAGPTADPRLYDPASVDMIDHRGRGELPPVSAAVHGAGGGLRRRGR